MGRREYPYCDEPAFINEKQWRSIPVAVLTTPSLRAERSSQRTIDMLYRLLADALVVTHFVFILFVLFGGLLVFKWKRFAWIHIPVIIWGVLIEYVGWWCPLTPLENWLRENGGDVPYRVSFIEHYLLPVIYPTALTREVQFVLGSTVLLVNVVIYGLVWRRSLRTGS